MEVEKPVIQKQSDCMKMQVEERDFFAAVMLRLAQGVLPSPHWAEIGRMMNLPE